jgi:23S rRNA (pseudouridine1915-N3)-methyltransferase
MLMALSKMTFTHEMARMIFLEQLYRGLNLLNGGSYHH